MTELFQNNDSGAERPAALRMSLWVSPGAASPGEPAGNPSHPVFPYRLHITKLMQAKVRQLPAKAALFHPAKGHAGIAGAVTIDKHPAALKLAGKAFRHRVIRGKDGG